jgi:hypothetical protein
MKIEIFDKAGNGVASWDVDEETCNRFKALSKEDIVLELATGIAVSLKEMGVDLTFNMIVNEWGKVVVCGREIDLAGNSRP